jgi:hypothetical protein
VSYFGAKPVFRIRITLMRIRILHFTLMRIQIRILLFTVMRIRVRIVPFNLIRILPLNSPPPFFLQNNSLGLPPFHLDADPVPDPTYFSPDGDPDPASQNDADMDADPQHWSKPNQNLDSYCFLTSFGLFIFEK